MWMVGYNEGGEFNNMVDHSFNARKFRALMPRPVTNSPNNIATITTTPCLARNIHGNDFFSPYHHLVGEQSKREKLFNITTSPAAVVVSSRWNPTPEQLRALEELYRRGTRTPSADQIQHITSQLRRFGKIEGKNVFYWFQNHKARERQKRRRQMESSEKELGTSKTVFEVEQTKNNWTPSTNCSITHAERAAKAAIAECRTDGWLQFDEGELQQRKNIMERNATWHVMQVPCPPHPAGSTHLINTPPNASANGMATTTSVTARKMSIMDPKLINKTHDLSFFISTQRENGVIHHLSNSISSSEDDIHNCLESQTTLQLFPLRSGDGSSTSDNINEKEEEISASAINANNSTPSQFFEFLPLKK